MGVRTLFRRLLRLESEAIHASASPPSDWSDERGWDAYHRVDERSPNLFDLGLRYIAGLRTRGFQRVWFPGCGTSLVPRVFAELGFEVLSTDFSSAAVAAQQRFSASALPAEVVTRLHEHRNDRPATAVSVLRHDFRTPLDKQPYDVILNQRAFQGLSRDDMRAAAKSHLGAVKPGGWTIFETVNVQGTRRDDIEDALADVGFEIPLRETERWYRSALRATGVDFLMILGRPLVTGPKRSEKEQQRLDALSSEYRMRAEQEVNATRAKLEDPSVRIAHIEYSTG